MPETQRDLYILHLEDDPHDAELVRETLAAERIGCTVTVVSTREAYLAALAAAAPDVILSDFQLPSFDGLAALAVARDVVPETPFIFVSGHLGEEGAIECVRRGATDYVLKTRLSRLGPAVDRAINEAVERRRRRVAEGERKQLEDQLRQSQKMEAMGRLAGGVAHDFNNLLMVISGYSRLLLAGTSEEGPARHKLTEIVRAADRAAGLTRQLLAFSRQQVLTPQVFDLSAVVTDVHKMLKRLIGEDIEVALVLHGGPSRIKADPGQIEQVLMNLAVNARDAMPDGGTLRIETRTVAGPVQEQRVVLRVSDSGCGMDEVTRQRVFEPFFTTKGPGKGTGLGLSTVYGIVQQSEGHIEIDSVVGQGTTFTITFPCASGPASSRAVDTSSAPTRHGNETILVLEDDEAVRTLVQDILAGAGYTILTAPDGAAARAMIASRSGPIHLLLTDIVLPGRSGRLVAEDLLATLPGMRLLFMSGYTDDAILHHQAMRDGIPFLQKPFAPDALLRAVREAIDGEGAAAA